MSDKNTSVHTHTPSDVLGGTALVYEYFADLSDIFNTSFGLGVFTVHDN